MLPGGRFGNKEKQDGNGLSEIRLTILFIFILIHGVSKNMQLKNTAVGIELGSTRIKAVLIDKNHVPLAFGSYEWENSLIDGVWSYSLAKVHAGVKACYADLAANVEKKYGVKLTTVGAIGVSAMMHGYLPFDKDGKQLAEFRTWRNTITSEASEKLTELFKFNIPQRWSVAHLYQAVLNGEVHLEKLAYLTTLAGYVHWKLTGKKVIGIGDASGMFPIDDNTSNYDDTMLNRFDSLLGKRGYKWNIRNILPIVLKAGEEGGTLTEEGALFLDPTGVLQPGIPVAPPEGDAGTGMVATNSVRVGTGNVSAGTSSFLMIVVDKALGVHRVIDMVTTPTGKPVAMVHCNNCTSDINAWLGLFGELVETLGYKQDKEKMFSVLFNKALEGRYDCGGLVNYNFFSGEEIAGVNAGCPLFLRKPDAEFSLANFMRTQLMAALATMKIGIDILVKTEKVKIAKLYGHGGYFKTPGVGQRILSALVEAPVSVMETAGEGGAYGMGILAGYMIWKDEQEGLESYLDNKVFKDAVSSTLMANNKEIEGSKEYMRRYIMAMPVEHTAVELYNGGKDA